MLCRPNFSVSSDGFKAFGRSCLLANTSKTASEFVFAQHSCKFISCLTNTISIVRINNENQSLGVLEVVSPQRTDFVLTADIPDGEGDVFVFHGFNIEADGG